MSEQKLREALQCLYDETADYIRINHLGDVHQNRSMRMARDALALQPPTSDEGTPLREAISAAKNMDWQQVVLNGGPPCFHLEEGRFCGRAARWAGHDEAHKFVSLADLMLAATPTPSDSKPGEGT